MWKHRFQRMATAVAAAGLAAMVTVAAAVSVSFNNTFDNGGATGPVSGGDLYKPGIGSNPSAQVGSNSSDNNTWGTGSSAAATGPDIGSTWRGAILVRASYVLDAFDPTGTLNTLADLATDVTNVVLTLTVSGVGPATRPDYAPRVHFHGIIPQTDPSAGYWGAWETVTLAAGDANTVAGAFGDNDTSSSTTVGDTFTFTFPGRIAGAVHTSDFISFCVVGNQDAIADERLSFTGRLDVYTAGHVISVNLQLSNNDNNAIEAADESAGIVLVLGSLWNSIQVANGGDTEPTLIQGRSYALRDDHGNTNAAMLTCTLQAGDGYTDWSDVTGTASGQRAVTGDAAMMHGALQYDLATDGGRHLEVSGLGHPFTTYGYDVYLYFEANLTRKYELRVTPEGGSALSTFGDDAGDNSDVDDDGVMEWKEASGTSYATANSANFARFRGLTARGFAIDLAGDSGRGTINAFQIVARDPPGVDLAPTISINLCNGNNDANTVSSDEVAGVLPVDGQHWNNWAGRYGTAGQPVFCVNRGFTLKDNKGNLAAATLYSSLDADDGYTAWATVANPSSTGDLGLMQSYLGYDVNGDNGHLEVSGLSGDFVNYGYDVYIFFERNSWRIVKYTVTPAVGSPVVVYGLDGESGNQFLFDGTWVRATGTSFGNANLSNYAKFEALNGSSFTIDVEEDLLQPNRMPVSGIQITARQTSGTLFIVR